MALRYYLMPMTLQGPNLDQLKPQYVSLLPAETSWGCIDYGSENQCLFYVETDAATNATLASQVGVDQLPVNIDAVLSAGAVTVVQAALESRNLPAQWVNTSLTFRQVLRTLAAILLFFERFVSIHGPTRIFGGAVTLDSTFNSLPAGVRTDLIAAANSFGYNTSSLSGASTLRQLMKAIADQWNGPIYLCGVL